MQISGRVLSGVVTFLSVVESGSFRTAARILEITPSGVSRAIARLEAELGVRLFHRHPRAVTLTDEGQRFHDEVQDLVDGISRAADALQDSSGTVKGKLKIQTCPPFGHYVLSPYIDRFLRSHPALSVEFEVSNQVGDIVRDGFDLAIRFGNPQPSSLPVRKLAETEVLTCAAPAYLKKSPPLVTPLDLLDSRHNCIDFRFPDSGRLATWDFLLDGTWRSLAVKSQMVVNDAPSLLAACLSGHGIAQPLELYAREALRNGRLVRLLPAWNQERFPLYAYLPSRRHPPAKVQRFLDFVEGLLQASN